jgi:hypothetical protein
VTLKVREIAGFHTVGGIYSRHEFLTWGDIPINLGKFVFWNSGFENLISLSVILRHLDAELNILTKMLKTHQGGYFHFLNPQIHFWWNP